MDLEQLIAGLDIRRVPPQGGTHAAPNQGPGGESGATRGGRNGHIRVCDITEDSRTVMPGSLFVARKGEKVDGRVFVNDAVAAGAVAVLAEVKPTGGPGGETRLNLPPGATMLVTHDIMLATAQLAERFYGDPSGKLTLCGVTGTNGKTTTTFLIHQLCNRAGTRCGLMGTVCVDDGSEVAPASLTTPPSLEVSRTLARMLECGCKAATMEVSSHSLHQRRVGALRFGVGVFTNLTHDHLDYHGTMEQYAAAKAMLFSSLPPADQGGVAIVNADDTGHGRMIRDCTAAIVRCSMKTRQSAAAPPADWAARVVAADARTTRIQLAGPWKGKAWDISLPLIGEHNVMNAMQAAAAAVAMGVPLGAVRKGLPRVKAPPGRLEPITGPRAKFTVYVDYAHTDDALCRVLTVMRKALDRKKTAPLTKAGKNAKSSSKRPSLVVVFGCGGDRDKTKRPKMGLAAASLADRVIVTSDNPRTESPAAIIDEILAGMPAGARSKVTVEADRQRAIQTAIGGAESGDVVLIAGKGHEDYQIMPDGAGGTIKRHFDDREVGRAALAALGPGKRARTSRTKQAVVRAPARKSKTKSTRQAAGRKAAERKAASAPRPGAKARPTVRRKA